VFCVDFRLFWWVLVVFWCIFGYFAGNCGVWGWYNTLFCCFWVLYVGFYDGCAVGVSGEFRGFAGISGVFGFCRYVGVFCGVFFSVFWGVLRIFGVFPAVRCVCVGII